VSSESLGLRDLFCDVLVLRFNVSCKLEVCHSVLVSYVDESVVGQGGDDVVECVVHLLSGSLEEASASCNEQCISCEQRSRIVGMRGVDDVVQDVT